jgi:hypothetical protein
MVLAVQDYLGEALGQGGARSQDGHLESPLQIAFGQALDPDQFLFVSSAKDPDQLIE